MNKDLTLYYNARAEEYDKVYLIPEEQDDLKNASILFQNIFNRKSVLEIACGTGYWTAKIAQRATAVHATDINQAVIDIAKSRPMNNNVSFEVVDMHHIDPNRPYDGIFGGFIWSHILLQDLDSLLTKIRTLIIENGDIVFIDSRPVVGSKHDKKRITRTDQYGNTFQCRTLENGACYEVLKNFPDKKFMQETLCKIAMDIKMIELEYYWIVTCKLKSISND